MKIEHIAIWVKDLEKMRIFYEKYFMAIANELYYNPSKGFKSYFLTFESGCRLELMNKSDMPSKGSAGEEHLGLTHLAFSVGSKMEVDQLTELLRKNSHEVIGEPRTTGDGYYESVVLDPEGNRIEITV